MIEDPDRWAPVRRGRLPSVTFHVEAAPDPRALARALRAAGARWYGAEARDRLRPYEDLLTDLDMVLVMTVEPGFGGQSFMADQMPRFEQVRDAVRRHERGDLDPGGRRRVSADTIEQCAEAGADVSSPAPRSTAPRTPPPRSTTSAPWRRGARALTPTRSRAGSVHPLARCLCGAGWGDGVRGDAGEEDPVAPFPGPRATSLLGSRTGLH